MKKIEKMAAKEFKKLSKKEQEKLNKQKRLPTAPPAEVFEDKRRKEKDKRPLEEDQ